MTTSMQFLSRLLLPVVLIGVVLTACEDDDVKPNNGDPVVHYVRSTDPALSDSLYTGAFMGSLIAIVGDNLGDTKELWFNDQKATLNPTYITDETIIVAVPSTVPNEVTDQMRFVFGDGSEYFYHFTVNVPSPVITGIKSEFVPDGGTVVLYGDFFFEPTTVLFPGDLEGEITLLEKTELQVTVPEGATPGPITVETKFGEYESDFLFRDNRNTLLDFDNLMHETWTAPVAYDGEGLVPNISGGYAYFEHDNFGAWQWINEMTMQYWAPRGRGNQPLATGSVDDLLFKFEANVPMEWRAVRMEIYFGPYAEDHGRDAAGTSVARWQPWMDGGPYTTDGWQTITIPLTEFKYHKDDPEDDEMGSQPLESLSGLTNITMMLFGPSESNNPVYVAFDNVRIVPK